MVMEEKKKEIWLTVQWQKPPHPQKIPKSNVSTQKGHHNFDYTTIADRLSWRNDTYPTGVVKPVYGVQASH